jgi:hypothetical protein
MRLDHALIPDETTVGIRNPHPVYTEEWVTP